MSDVMTDAAAPAVVDETVVAPPNPIQTDNVDHGAQNRNTEDKQQPKPAEKAEEPKKLSTREILEKATAKVEAQENGQDKDKPAKTVDAERDETGKFRVKDKEQPQQQDRQHLVDDGKQRQDTNKPAQPHDEAPERFSPEAKATWRDTPEHVRAETHRAVRELQTGIQEHQKRWEPLQQFDELARQSGTTMHEALANYVGMEQTLRKDPLAGLEAIVSNLDIKTHDGRTATLRDLAAHILGQKPDEVAGRQDSTIQELKRQIEVLTKELQGVGHAVSTGQQNQAMASINQEIDTFATTHPRVREPEFEKEMAFAITSGRAQTLPEAYEFAEKLLGPGKAAQQPNPDPVAQTDKGRKSIAGAPSAGSDPASHKPSSSVRESVRRAMQATG